MASTLVVPRMRSFSWDVSDDDGTVTRYKTIAWSIPLADVSVLSTSVRPPASVSRMLRAQQYTTSTQPASVARTGGCSDASALGSCRRLERVCEDRGRPLRVYDDESRCRPTSDRSWSCTGRCRRSRRRCGPIARSAMPSPGGASVRLLGWCAAAWCQHLVIGLHAQSDRADARWTAT